MHHRDKHATKSWRNSKLVTYIIKPLMASWGLQIYNCNQEWTQFKKVKSFQYLGATPSKDGSSTTDICFRIVTKTAAMVDRH